ncbi:MAG: hypothetical protein WCV55_00515 [Candidatus Paceibacterota bacterium]
MYPNTVSKIFKFKIKNNSKTEARPKLVCGFTLLYASMIAGLLLAIGAAILSITIKQVSLSAAGRESQFAFYNADTGTECALYLYRSSKSDICPAGFFPEVGNTSNSDASCSNAYTTATCLGVFITNTNFSPGTGLYSFSIASTTPNNICFDVIVDRRTPTSTAIISKGYNTCSSVNRFERAIEVDF